MRKSGLPPPHPRPEVQPRGSCPTLRGSRRVSAPPPPHSPQSLPVVQSQGEKMLLVLPLPVLFPPPPVCSPSLLLPSPMPPSVPVTLKVKGLSHLLLSSLQAGAGAAPPLVSTDRYLFPSQGCGLSRLDSTEGWVSLECSRG